MKMPSPGKVSSVTLSRIVASVDSVVTSLLRTRRYGNLVPATNLSDRRDRINQVICQTAFGDGRRDVVNLVLICHDKFRNVSTSA
jgi:hypothetical protein